MKTIRFFRLLTVRIILLAICVIAWSYLTDYIQESTIFFEDIKYEMYTWKEIRWDWGWRHYVWSGLGIVLFLTSVARIIIWGDWYWTQVKRNDNVDLKCPENKLF